MNANPPTMSGKTLEPFGLTGYHCEECGRPVSQRLYALALTGCAACDEVITRHRCTGRPALNKMETGESWECPACGTTWRAVACEEPCEECGKPRLVKGWDSQPGDRIDAAPRYEPRWSPAGALVREYMGRAFSPLARPEAGGSCYRMTSGATVHVKPDCRCG